jgi:hypothetical protein
MHFAGVHDELPAVTNFSSGDVIIVDSKEYVLCEEGDGDTKTKTWRELGDQNAYVGKDTFNTKVEELEDAIDSKVDKVEGKGLSTNDFTDAYKTQLDNLETDLATELEKKVDKVDGSRLMTDAEGEKLDGIAEGAEVNTIVKVTLNGVEIAPDGNRTVDIVISEINGGTSAAE